MAAFSTSETVENYLKAVFELEEEHGRATTKALAEHLGVASSTVTAMLKRLANGQPPMVDYTSHQGVTLAPAGRRKALEIIRHHRLLETFLHNVLGYGWEEVHEEAEKLEHHISERFEACIDAYMGHPTHDPHGAPIPTAAGEVPEASYTPLNRVACGVGCRVLRVKHDEAEILRYLDSLGLRPGVVVTVVDKAPFDGPLQVRVGTGPVHALAHRLAGMVYVQPAGSGEAPPEVP